MTARAAARSTTIRRTASVRRLQDPRLIRRRLAEASAYAAYAIAYLDPRLFPLAEFYEAIAGDKRAMVMHARGGPGPATLTHGDTSLVQTILQLHPGPHQAFITAEAEHVDMLLETHNLWRPQTMLRMQVEPGKLRVAEGLPAVRRLIDSDAHELNRLYAVEEEGLRYSGRQVTQGVYFGAHVRNRLVAAAGTHIYSRHEGVGVVGNVFTHPDFRSHGLGTSVTAAVTSHLLEHCDLVVLNVDPANRTARHIYESLGFVDTGRVIEAMATRRDAYSPLPLYRRFMARWRGSASNTEVVEL
ncbi:MAG TPA: GNAT family N-acetyltransferase [Dehalococcoidia bacterium]|nr:GNAT family N-acetyltransferase [Dehalococcoidia bacterium]